MLGYTSENEPMECPLFKGTISIGNTSEPTIDFQGTFVNFQGSIDEKSCAVVEKSFIWGG